MEGTTGRLNVMGKSSAMAIDGVSPGIAPMIIPGIIVHLAVTFTLRLYRITGYSLFSASGPLKGVSTAGPVPLNKADPAGQ